MEKEKTNKNIYQALLAAQQDMGPVYKNATNPAFKSKYADLSAVIETITESLHKHGLVFYQSIDIEASQPILVTNLRLAEDEGNGEWIQSKAPIVSKDPNDPQKFGAAVTYMRRYSLLALLGLAPEDDDGNFASTPSQGHSSPSQPASKPSVNRASGEVVGTSPDDTQDGVCSHCGKKVPGKSVYWSNKKHGRTLCWDDQQLAESGQLTDSSVGGQSNVEAAEELDSLFARGGQ